MHYRLWAGRSYLRNLDVNYPPDENNILFWYLWDELLWNDTDLTNLDFCTRAILKAIRPVQDFSPPDDFIEVPNAN